MINVIILGSGAVAAEVCSYIRDINKTAIVKINVKGFVDDNIENFKTNAVKYNYDQPYLGTSDSCKFNNEDKYILGFANIKSRLGFLNKEISKKMSFFTLL